MKLRNLDDLFLDELQDVYHAEIQLTKALPKMIKIATCQHLRAGLESHLKETQEHVERLKQIFKLVKKPVKAKKCHAMEGILKESQEVFDAKFESDDVRDALIICMAQKVEHYEIASYGTLRAWGELMGLKEIVKILTRTLAEEKSADEKLSELALLRTNSAANLSDQPQVVVLETVETF